MPALAHQSREQEERRRRRAQQGRSAWATTVGKGLRDVAPGDDQLGVLAAEPLAMARWNASRRTRDPRTGSRTCGTASPVTRRAERGDQRAVEATREVAARPARPRAASAATRHSRAPRASRPPPRPAIPGRLSPRQPDTAGTRTRSVVDAGVTISHVPRLELRDPLEYGLRRHRRPEGERLRQVRPGRPPRNASGRRRRCALTSLANQSRPSCSRDTAAGRRADLAPGQRLAGAGPRSRARTGR